jgi:hypothetical protein
MPEESTTVAIAERVREALQTADLSAIADVLDPAVRWGAPDNMEGGCQNRKQVLDWYRRGRDRGARAAVTEVAARGDKIFVGLKVTGAPAAEELGGEAQRWQVLTVVDGLVVDIRGFDDRNEAVSHAGLRT